MPYTKKKIKRKCIWIQPGTGRTSSTSQPGYTRYDSVLEWKVSEVLNTQGVKFQHHKDLILIPGIQGVFNSYSWQCDFFLNTFNIPLEVKGKWILDKDRRSEKKLFEMQWALTLSKFPRAKIVSDSNFKIGQFDVYNYSEIDSWVQWYSQ